jgi:hypothetical protein
MDGTTPEIHTNSGIPSDPIHDRSSLAHNLSKTVNARGSLIRGRSGVWESIRKQGYSPD